MVVAGALGREARSLRLCSSCEPVIVAVMVAFKADGAWVARSANVASRRDIGPLGRGVTP